MQQQRQHHCWARKHRCYPWSAPPLLIVPPPKVRIQGASLTTYWCGVYTLQASHISGAVPTLAPTMVHTKKGRTGAACSGGTSSSIVWARKQRCYDAIAPAFPLACWVFVLATPYLIDHLSFVIGQIEQRAPRCAGHRCHFLAAI